MRVQLRAGDDSGAVAVLVAILSLVLIGLAAFALDFGNAYATQRKLSVNADSASLAAAAAINSVVTPTSGASCNTATGTFQPAAVQTAAVAAATAAATQKNAQGDLSGRSTVSSVTVSCTSDDAQVTVANTQSVPTFLGGILGVSSTNPNATATSRLFVPASAGGLRPLAACLSTVNARYGSGRPFLVYMDNGGSPCGVGASGNWGVLNFDEQAQYETASFGGPFDDPGCSNGGSATCQELWMSEGYYSNVWVPNPNPYVSTPTGSTTGLGGSTGGALSNGFKSAMQTLAQTGATVSFPVAEWVRGPGNNAVYGVRGIITVQVCAAYVQNTSYSAAGVLPATACDNSVTGVPNRAPYTTPLPGQTLSDYQWWVNGGNNRYALWVQPTSFVTSGPSGPRSGCFLVSGCDLGTRGVQLFR